MVTLNKKIHKWRIYEEMGVIYVPSMLKVALLCVSLLLWDLLF